MPTIDIPLTRDSDPLPTKSNVYKFTGTILNQGTLRFDQDKLFQPVVNTTVGSNKAEVIVVVSAYANIGEEISKNHEIKKLEFVVNKSIGGSVRHDEYFSFAFHPSTLTYNQGNSNSNGVWYPTNATIVPMSGGGYASLPTTANKDSQADTEEVCYDIGNAFPELKNINLYFYNSWDTNRYATVPGEDPNKNTKGLQIIFGLYCYQRGNWIVENNGTLENCRIRATYELKKYNITFKKQTGGVFKVNSSQITQATDTRVLEHGTSLTLKAEPAANYKLVGWSDDSNNKNLQRTVTVTGEKTYYPIFQIKQSTINFSSDGNGTITVKKDGAAINTGATVDYGTAIDCTANPASGYALDYWKVNGVNVGSDIDYSFAASQDTYTIVAVFRELQITQLQITEVSILGNDDQAVVPSQSSAANIRIKIKPTYG